MIIWIIVIVLIIYYTVKGKPGPPPPKIIDHNYVSPSSQYIDDDDDDDEEAREKYNENHYFDIFNACWVKQYPSGDYVKSCSFEDLQAGRADDQGPISVTYCIPADEYSDDPDWLDNKREHWRQWTNLWRDDPP